MRPRTWFFPLFFLLVAACSQAPTTSDLNDRNATIGFDVNDVSILWPLPKTASEIPLLPTPAEFGGLSNLNLGTLLMRAQADDEPTFNYWRADQWHVVGVRFDPCQKVNPTDSDCIVEFRLVVQPLKVFEDGMVLPEDNALHLIYKHDSAAGVAIARRLHDLKIANGGSVTNGIPLGVHPIMATQGLTGPFARGMRELLATYAKEAFLAEATAMVVVDRTDWRFARTLGNGRQLIPASIPFVEGPFQTLFGGTRPEGRFVLNEIRPGGTGDDNLNDMVDSDTNGSFWSLENDVQNALADSALRIDNPLRHTPSTVDCVSCHMATRTLTRFHGKEYLTNQDGNPNRFPAPANVTLDNTTNVNELVSGYSVRIFGYGFFRGNTPTATQRAVNDSARIANLLNRDLLGL